MNSGYSKYIISLETKDSLTDVEVIEPEGRINLIECNIYIKFSEIQNQIETLCDENNLEQEYNERNSFVNNYCSYLPKVRNSKRKGSFSNKRY